MAEVPSLSVKSPPLQCKPMACEASSLPRHHPGIKSLLTVRVGQITLPGTGGEPVRSALVRLSEQSRLTPRQALVSKDRIGHVTTWKRICLFAATTLACLAWKPPAHSVQQFRNHDAGF